MSERAFRFPLELVFALVVLASGWFLHRSNLELERFVQAEIDTGEVGPLPDGEMLRVLSLGFERLIADLYWIRTVFYVGSEAASDANYPSAADLAHLITDIDPSFDSVYVLMSSVLGGLRYDPDAAIELLEKGARHSDYWRVHFLLGFNYFMEKGDYEQGAKHLERAVELGGPTYLPLLISRLYTHGGDPQTAILFLQERLRNEGHPKVRKKLQKRLSDVLINRDMGILNRAIGRFREARGTAPASMQELLDTGFLRKPMVDPTGRPYAIVDGEPRSETPFEVLELKE